MAEETTAVRKVTHHTDETTSEEMIAFRKAAAEKEEAWQGAGLEPGALVWRIEHFQVKPVEKDTYGKFHEGDSYIVLRTTANPDSGALHHAIHFWIGNESTNDEYGTAAYKTNELHDFFQGEGSEHRETQGDESDEFKQIFGGQVEYLPGGCPTGFRHVVPEGHETKLYQVRKVKKTDIQCIRIPLQGVELHDADCYVLETEKFIYVLDGPKASGKEKHVAGQKAGEIETERNGLAKVSDVDEDFWKALDCEKPSWAATQAYVAAEAPTAAAPAAAPTQAAGFFSLAQLQVNPPPEGVKPSEKEKFLSDADFTDTFQMSKEDFAKLPVWKQTGLKKEKKLY